ncbi:MAG: TonB-dependent receptor [Acidobacteriota bacterium]|nr:MAG: TonB-dependent receptor [Acidobacteriota bacterium]
MIPPRYRSVKRRAAVMALLGLPILAVCAISPARAWSGRLIDLAGDPLVGARVTPVATTGGAVTGPDGRFKLPGTLTDVSTVLVELADGTTLVVDLPRQAGDDEELVLQVDPGRQVTLDVSAPAAGQIHAPPAAPTRSFSTREISERASGSLQQLVSSLPGTERSVEDPDAVPVLRGLGQGRTLLLLDGAAIQTERRAGVSGGVFEQGTWGGIDIVRGPASVVYGSAAMGGVVLVKSPWDGVDGPRRLAAETEWREGDAGGYAAALRWRRDGWSVAAGSRRGKAPRGADGAPLDGQYRQQSLFAGKTWLAGRTLMRLGLRTDRLADAERLGPAEDGRLTVVPEETLHRLTWHLDIPGRREGEIIAWAADAERAVTQRRVGDDQAVSALTAITRQRDLGARGLWRGQQESFDWLAGAELRSRFDVETKISATGLLGEAATLLDERPLFDASERAIALFGQLNRRLSERVAVSAGLRLEPLKSEASSAESTQVRRTTATAGTLALDTSFGRGGHLVAQLARGFREPTLSQRFYRGITGRGLLIDNRELQREVSRHVDVAWRLVRKNRFVEIALFDTRIEDVIVRNFDQPGSGPLGLDVYRFANAGRATVRGLELTAGLTSTRSGQWQLTLHRLRGEDGFDRSLADIPADGLDVLWSGHDQRGRWLRAELRARARDEHPGPGERVTPGYVTADVAVGLPLGRGVTLRIGVTNLLDQPLLASARDDAPIAPGRTGSIKLTFASDED